jgi:RNA polymerase sigma factor
MRELDNLAIKASKNQMILEQLIQQEEPYIMKCASTVTNHYITKSDDEWSIALTAFVEAVQSYDLDKGSFLAFAKLVMQRRIIDYLRSCGKYHSEVSVDPIVFSMDATEVEDVSLRIAVAKQVTKEAKEPIHYEIIAINEVFANYEFTFMDLTNCSPHAKKTKNACAQAIVYITSSPLIIEELRRSKQLPLKIIEKNAKVPRKILERQRKYIIAATEIISGEYPNLAEYLRFIREEKEL